MKRLIIVIFAYYLFVSASKPTEWWVVYYETENEIHKCTREDYLEMMQFFEDNEPKELQKRINKYLNWELTKN